MALVHGGWLSVRCATSRYGYEDQDCWLRLYNAGLQVTKGPGHVGNRALCHE